MTDRREQEKREDVYVVTAIPKNGNRSFVYGVFKSLDYAHEYYNTHGCPSNDYWVTKEMMISLA
jgi:hypothetical protein